MAKNRSTQQTENKGCRQLFDFIRKSPTAFHAVENIHAELEEAGFQYLHERENWKIEPGGAYYTVRGGSSLIAFRVPATCAGAFRIIASHSDSPALKLKPNAEMEAAGAYTMLNVEPYGGGIWHTWMDRPLSIAGRLVTRGKKGIEMWLVNIDRDLLIIPSLAIHMDRDVNKKLEIHAQKDLLPVFGDLKSKGELRKLLAGEVGCREEDILGEDLFLYSRVQPAFLGAKEEFFCGPRIDDLECVYGSLQGFLRAGGARSQEKTGGPAGSDGEKPIAVYAVFDNEEVGSDTKQGAGSTFLASVLERICDAMGMRREEYHRMAAGSFLVSADNAHAVHPNAADKADPVNRPVMNGGIVLKHNANQKYTTDAISAALFKEICCKEKIPVQEFTNRSDMPGGSTLGNISNTQISMTSVDIGLAQLAMHAACETAGVRDLQYLAAFSESFYNAAL